MATRIRQKAEKLAQQPKYPYAIGKYIRMSSSKIAYILDLIRGKKATVAVAILENMTDKGAFESLKVLNSAIANAENNMGKNRNNLIVKEAYATSAPQFKRISWRGKGGSDTIIKKSSHITIVLEEIGG